MSTTTAARIGPADHGRMMTLDEFREAEVEEGYRYELAGGVLEVSEVPGDDHGQIVWNLLAALRDFQRERPGLISRCGGGSEFRLWIPAMNSGRNPDVAVALRGTPKDHRGRRPPTLVAEVVSEGAEAHRRDHEIKRREYLVFGIQEYWIIEPEARRVTVLTRRGDTWGERVFTDGQAAEGLALPGFAVPVSDLWINVENLGTN